MQWFWGRSYSVKCPDGTRKTVYRNVDDAFPLFIPGWQGDLSVGGSGSAKTAGIDELKAEAKGAYTTKIQGLLFAIDDLTQTVMLNFRTVYLTFATDPCTNGDFLQRQIEKLVAEQQRISRLRIQVRALIELAKNQPNETVQILTIFKEVAGNLGGGVAVEATKVEIVEARQLADRWSDQ
jgi:hypothetical protein